MLLWFRPLVWTKNYILYSSFHFKTCSSIKVLFTHELCSISEKSFGICFPKFVQFLHKQAGMFSTKFFLIWITQKETVHFTHVRLTGNTVCFSWRSCLISSTRDIHSQTLDEYLVLCHHIEITCVTHLRCHMTGKPRSSGAAVYEWNKFCMS